MGMVLSDMKSFETMAGYLFKGTTKYQVTTCLGGWNLQKQLQSSAPKNFVDLFFLRNFFGMTC